MSERLGWCPADDCPTSVCGGVHREVLTSLGIENPRRATMSETHVHDDGMVGFGSLERCQTVGATHNTAAFDALISETRPPVGSEVREEWGVRDTDGELIPLASHRSLEAWRRRGLTLVRRTVTTTAWEVAE